MYRESIYVLHEMHLTTLLLRFIQVLPSSSKNKDFSLLPSNITIKDLWVHVSYTIESGSRNCAARQRALQITLDLADKIVKKKYYYLTLYVSLFAFHFYLSYDHTFDFKLI